MTSWLSKQKKAELQSLAKSAGLKDDGLLKDDLVIALDEHLKANATTLSGDKTFSDYYGRSSSSKPRASASADAPEEKKPARRKTLTPSDGSSTAVVPRTPASLQRLASHVRLPHSPAVSRAVTAQTTWISNKYKTFVKKSNIKTKSALLRQELGSVETIHLLILIFEAVGLRRFTLPFAAATIPAVDSLRLKDTQIWVPVISTIATKTFWAPTTLWLLTSLIIPGVFAYLFNLTFTQPSPRTRRTKPVREYDPMVFSIVKGLLAWIVYANGAYHPGFSAKTVGKVEEHIYGGYTSLLIGAGVGVLTSISDNLAFKS